MKATLYTASGEPLLADPEPSTRTVEVVRSFAYKVNLQNHGGPAYESIDLFASQKVFCAEHEAEDASEAAYQFCRSEVLRSAREVIADLRTKAQKGRAA